MPGDAEHRRYTLLAAHREVLLDETSPYFLAPAPYALAGTARVLPELLAAYRSGDGVPFAAYGEEIRDHIEQLNRPMFANDLAATWLPAVPELHTRLQADPPARVAEIACGAGWVSIALAKAYPAVRVEGFDRDESSIRRARRNAADAGVGDRVSFAVRDAADPGLAGRYDAAMIFEALHDVGHPVETLASVRAMLTDGGCLLVGDTRAGETFTAPGDEVERLLYGFSILHCLPTGRTETASAATGAVLHPATLRAYAAEAGLRDVQILPIEHEMWRFYLLASQWRAGLRPPSRASPSARTGRANNAGAGRDRVYIMVGQSPRANDSESRQMTSAQRGHEVRQRLLGAAAELIAERGWAAVSTRAVAERAGLAPGLVHYHFTSVQSLLSRAAIAVMQRAAAETGPLWAGVGDRSDLADALVASLDAYTGTDPVSVLFVETYLAATRDPELRAGVAEVITQFRTGLATRLAELGVAEPESTAAVLGAAMDGLVLQRALDPTLSAAAIRPVIRRTLLTTERQEEDGE